jgi:succinate dehydrogenase/fumarate reductase cytochrome b subunit
MERWERFAPLTGVAAIVLFIVGVIVEESGASRPDDDNPAAVLEWFQDKADTLVVTTIMFGVAAVLLIWFFGSLRAALVEAEGGTARLSSIAFGSGLLAALGVLMAVAPTAQGAFSKDDLSPQTAQSLVLLSDSAFGVTEFALVPMFVAVGLLTLKTRVLPIWLGWVSFAIAILLLILPIGWAGVVWAFPLWTIVVSIILFRRGSGRAAVTAPPAL